MLAETGQMLQYEIKLCMFKVILGQIRWNRNRPRRFSIYALQ